MSQSHDLTIVVPTSDVSSETRSYNVVASDDQLSELVERFKIISLSKLVASVKVASAPTNEGYSISGHIEAELEQQCIVSLEPVKDTIDENFELMLVSPEIADQFDADEVYLDPEAPDYDALESDKIELGEIVAQTLSVLINPYPRRSDVELTELANKAVTVNQELEKRPNPFAALSKLNDES